MMRQFKMRAWLLGSLAAVLSMGAANEVFAFQQAEERPIIPPNTIQEDAAQPDTARPNVVDRQADLRNDFTGEFTSQHQGMITITREGDNPRTFRMVEDTQVTLNGRPTELQALRKGDQIRVIQGADGAVLRLEASRRADEAPIPNTAQRRESGFRGPSQNADQQESTTKSDREERGTAWLGVMLREGEQGVEVARTYPSGPASRAGLYSGDVVLEIDNKEISSPQDANLILSQAKPSEQVEIVVKRGDERRTLTATLGDRRVFLGEPQRPMQEEFPQGDDFEDAPIAEHAMMLEQHRRLAEQHQRIEEKLDQVLKEMQELRQQLGQRRPAGAAESRRPAGAAESRRPE